MRNRRRFENVERTPLNVSDLAAEQVSVSRQVEENAAARVSLTA
jgi:hypothetical protein